MCLDHGWEHQLLSGSASGEECRTWVVMYLDRGWEHQLLSGSASSEECSEFVTAVRSSKKIEM